MIEITPELKKSVDRLSDCIDCIVEKFNPNHDAGGRFSSGGGGVNVHMAPDTGGSSGGGGGGDGDSPKQTIESISNSLKDRFNIYVEVDMKDKERAISVLSTVAESVESIANGASFIDDVYRRSSYGAGGMKISIVDGKTIPSTTHPGTRALATYNKGKHQLVIAGGLRTTNAVEKPNIGSKHNVGTDLKTVVAHELGHAVSGKIALEASKGGTRVGKELYDSKPKSYWEHGVSSYAATNYRELMAESFAAYTHPGYSKTRGLPKELTDVFSAAGMKPGTRKSWSAKGE